MSEHLAPTLDFAYTDVGYLSEGSVSTAEHPLDTFGNPHFRCLGIDGTTVFTQPYNVPEIISFPATQLKGAPLLRIAPLQWWEMEFPSRGKEGADWNAAANAIMESCKRAGKYDPDKVTGRGTFIEPGSAKIVTHMGNHLLVNGEDVTLGYPSPHRIFVERSHAGFPVKVDPLTDKESARIAKLAERLDWESPDMAKLFVGWCVIAPVCGSLKWRPHIWIKGPFESGKSFALNKFAGGLLTGVSLQVGGGVTEPGIRQQLGCDALPVLMDEAESKDEASTRRIDAILELARSAAQQDGARVLKGSVSGRSAIYRVRSSFAFASIDTSFKQSADESRIIQVSLRGPDPSIPNLEKAERAKEFRHTEDDLSDLLQKKYGPRLFMRTVQHLHTLHQNAEVFGRAIREKTNSGRLGDTLGPLVAGYYSLFSISPVTRENAEELIGKWSWLGTAMTRSTATKDHDVALRHLLESSIIMDGGQRRTVAEVIRNSCDPTDTSKADEVLKRHGMRVDLDGDGLGLLLCKGHIYFNVAFHGTQWANNPVDTIAQNPAAQLPKNPVRFSAGIKQRAVRIDLTAVGFSEDD